MASTTNNSSVVERSGLLHDLVTKIPEPHWQTIPRLNREWDGGADPYQKLSEAFHRGQQQLARTWIHVIQERAKENLEEIAKNMPEE